ncbi:APC family permease [Alicyclobacillus herbarius]|uniref:APC family permease n=1 Tax=Alicyclobacillus herbarius TaxID=122960 RepID=UPI00040F3685|nr:APC family permease [Alicyclobacillus herbarius]
MAAGEQNGKLKRQLTLSDLIFVGFGAIFGSGWLFAASTVASQAGPAGWISWLVGGIAVILLGLVYAELGGAIPRAGGIVRYPVYSHGPLLGYLMGFATLIAYSSLCSIEVEAARQYASSWWPALSQPHSQSPTLLGWWMQVALLFVFFLLNYWSVRTFAKTNTVMTILKFVVPTLTFIVLLCYLRPTNFTMHGFAPFGVSGVETAISAGGVMFAYLGLQPIVSVASEAKRPQKTVPLALILSVLLSAVVYVLLQVSFIGAIPADKLAHGWAPIVHEFQLPFHDLAVTLGTGWLAVLIVLDAIVSPSGSANIFMNSSSRIVYGWAKNGTLFKVFARIHPESGIPRPAVWLSFLLSIFWTLPFPSWGTLIGVVSDALVLTYALAPISAYAFRRNASDLPRPFRLPGMAMIGPVAFIIASLIVYWTGWQVDSWLLGSQLVMFVIYLLARRFVPTDKVPFAEQVRCSWWLVFYYAAILVVSKFGSFGGAGALSAYWDHLLVAVIAVITYYWGGHTGLSRAMFDEDEVEG